MAQGWIKDNNEWTLDALPFGTKIKKWRYYTWDTHCTPGRGC